MDRPSIFIFGTPKTEAHEAGAARCREPIVDGIIAHVQRPQGAAPVGKLGPRPRRRLLPLREFRVAIYAAVKNASQAEEVAFSRLQGVGTVADERETTAVRA